MEKQPRPLRAGGVSGLLEKRKLSYTGTFVASGTTYTFEAEILDPAGAFLTDSFTGSISLEPPFQLRIIKVTPRSQITTYYYANGSLWTAQTGFAPLTSTVQSNRLGIGKAGGYASKYFYITDVQPTQPLSTPTGLYADNITSDSARVSWNAVDNASGYKVEYRRQGDTTWNE